MADGTIKDTFEGQLEEFMAIFEADDPIGKREFASHCFSTGAQCAILLTLQRIFHCKSLSDIPNAIESLHQEIEDWHKKNPLK